MQPMIRQQKQWDWNQEGIVANVALVSMITPTTFASVLVLSCPEKVILVKNAMENAMEHEMKSR